MSRALLGLLVFLVAVPRGHAERARVASPDEQVLALVNRYRARVGVPPVQLDAKLSKGCMEHAEYMRLNRNTPAMAGLNAHHQDPALPGATPAGAACGKAADLYPGVSDLGAAVEGWMASLYHRRPILAPTLKRIGVGHARLDDGSLMAALMFVDGKGAEATEAAALWPVAYPAKDQTALPLEFGNEIPNPIPKNGKGGFPITLQFPPFDKVTNVTATLEDGAGKPVRFHLSTPERPATSFGQYGVVCLIPVTNLRPDTRYKASVTATWKDTARTWSWGFTTVGLRRVDATDEAALLGALGQPSLVRGTIAYGGMMDTDTAFLMIGSREGKRIKMVSVIIPLSVWRAGTRDADPKTWMRGEAVDVEATPQFVRGSFLNLGITDMSLLRFVPPAP